MTRLRRDDGFTLIELLVGLSIGTIVLFGAFTVLDQVSPGSNRVVDRVESQSRGRNAMTQVLSELRSTVCVPQGAGATMTFDHPFAAASTDTVTFYVQIVGAPSGGSDPGLSAAFTPEKRQLDFSGGKLLERRWTGSWDGGTSTWTFPGAATTRVVLPNAQPDNGKPYFEYYTYETDGTMSERDLAAGASVSAADVARVVRVDVAFNAGPDGRGSSGTGYRASFEDSATVPLPVDFTTPVNAAKGPQCAA